jgi:hypothetical protein
LPAGWKATGVPGHVNISAATYELVKDKYECTYRGKIFAKNIGDIDMYFVHSRKVTPTHEIKSQSLTTPISDAMSANAAELMN